MSFTSSLFFSLLQLFLPLSPFLNFTSLLTFYSISHPLFPTYFIPLFTFPNLLSSHSTMYPLSSLSLSFYSFPHLTFLTLPSSLFFIWKFPSSSLLVSPSSFWAALWLRAIISFTSALGKCLWHCGALTSTCALPPGTQGTLTDVGVWMGGWEKGTGRWMICGGVRRAVWVSSGREGWAKEKGQGGLFQCHPVI